MKDKGQERKKNKTKKNAKWKTMIFVFFTCDCSARASLARSCRKPDSLAVKGVQKPGEALVSEAVNVSIWPNQSAGI
jgi:hypothetical protein